MNRIETTAGISLTAILIGGLGQKYGELSKLAKTVPPSTRLQAELRQARTVDEVKQTSDESFVGRGRRRGLGGRSDRSLLGVDGGFRGEGGQVFAGARADRRIARLRG